MGQRAPSLRELNRRRTRQLISDVATTLFLARGFDRVTIAEVAAAAGVAKMTVTNHFPRKEDLVLDIHEELVAGPARVVATRAVGESALAALRRHALHAVEHRDPTLGFSDGEFVGMLLGSTALLARLREIHEQREGALADALAAETHAAPGDLTPRLAAAHLAAAWRVLFDEVLRRTLAGEDDASVRTGAAAAAQQTFDLLEPSLGTYAVR